MASRKDLIREYKERKKPPGVYQIKNTVNGKLLLGGSLNLEGVLNLEDELSLLEQIWLEKLEPYGDRGYNVPGAKIRTV